MEGSRRLGVVRDEVMAHPKEHDVYLMDPERHTSQYTQCKNRTQLRSAPSTTSSDRDVSKLNIVSCQGLSSRGLHRHG